MYLEFKNPEKNQYRFYRITATRSLFGKLILTRQWGRIGSRNPRSINHEFSDVNELVQLVREALKVRQRHHYRVINARLTIPSPLENDPLALRLTARQDEDMIQLIVEAAG
jgi:predicted DNA-binding WGR domain protein